MLDLKEKVLEKLIEKLEGMPSFMDEEKHDKEVGAPDPSPEHEAKESPAMEALEHATGMEMQDEEKEDEDEDEEEGGKAVKIEIVGMGRK